MPKVVHFDIIADEPESLKKFYEDVFEWKFDKWDDSSGQMDYWLINTGKGEHGIDGGMTKRNSPKEEMGLTIGVIDIDSYIEKIKKNGGEIITPKMAIPGIGWIVSFVDPQGNNFMMMEEDKNAK